MNNIETEQLKRDIKSYLGYDIEFDFLNENKINKVKNQIEILKEKERIKKSNEDAYQIKLIKRKLNDIFDPAKVVRNVVISDNVISDNSKGKTVSVYKNDDGIKKSKKVQVPANRKPRILFISDVKGWAWWIKSEYLKEHLSDEFDISIDYVIGDGCIPYDKIDQKLYDLYFTYGYSYIDFLNKVPRHKKVTGITAHRRKNIILPKMKVAGHVHANSMMLLKELNDMGFKEAHYIPNGVNENLFKIITPIKKQGDLIVGHVGKECPVKGQREFILPAIKKIGAKSVTNLRTWKDKIPHDQMPITYNEMDVFMVASTEDGTPNPALEAAACGRPIISNAIGNMPEFIKDGYNGFIVPRKIEAYVEKLKYFQDNRDELIRMGKNARKTILKNWTWKKQSENYRKMFRNIFEMGKS